MKVKILFLVSLFLVPLTYYGQSEYIIDKINVDSLQQVLPELDGTDKIDALNKIAYAIFSRHPDSCQSITANAISMSEQIGYKKGLADGWFNTGNAYFIQDSIKLAMINYLKAKRIYESLPTCIEKALLFDVLASLNYDAGRIDKSKHYNKKAIEVYRHLSENRYELIAVNNFACRFWYYEWDSAYYYHNQVLELLHNYPDSVEMSRTYMYLSTISIAMSNTASGEADYEAKKKHLDQCLLNSIKSLELFQQSNPTWFDSIYLLPAIYINLAVGLNATGSEDSVMAAREYLNAIVHMSDTGNTLSPEYTLTAYYTLALRKRRSGDVEGGLELYEKGIREAEKQLSVFQPNKYLDTDPSFELILMVEYRYRLAWVYYWVYRAFEDYGNFEKALEYHVLYEKASEDIYKKDNENLIAMLEAESENEKAENQIAMLERDKQISDLRASQSIKFNIGIGALFILLLLAGLLFIRQNKLKNEQKNTILEQKLFRLQMNPHFIFNALSNIMNFIEDNNNKSAITYLSKFSKLLRITLESSREDYILLEDEINSIQHYLELQQLRYEDKFEYSILTDETIDIENAVIPPMLLQPFIENAIEHGIRHKEEKGKVIIRFNRKEDKIVCEIEDDGVGREKAWEAEYQHKTHKSLATDIISDRLQVLNKKLKQKIFLNIIDLRSDNDKPIGTMVRLDLPYLLD